ncbi:unnamed protein product [Mucor circinelloides]|uniref:TM7S3/TM198-like domain-containing protein n=1 Tax=Mucor circinelloides f. circinelloides (strain 1006PhL) TaxID=1220926 RepID=S2IZ58_MUCC1|nr:hypothetical protein HMPREF1544_10203 [Mucor circinelloides 1006PhL]
MSHVLLTTLILAFVTQSVHAAPAVDQPTYEPGVLYLPDKAIALDDGYSLSIQGVLGGIVLIVCGLLLACRPIWDRTPAGTRTQELAGFVTMGFVTWVMLANFEPEQTYGQNRQTIYFIVPFIVGLVVITCMSVTIQLYLMLIGGLGGLAFGLWILGWKDDLSITSNSGRAILLTVLVVVFMVLSLYSCFWHQLGAALAGSYIFFMGLDIYFHTGFNYCFTTTLDRNHEHDYRMHRGVYIMQSCIIIAYIVGFIFQVIGHHSDHIRMQHSVVMSTRNDPRYITKQPFIGRYMPAMPPFWRPNWFQRGGAPPAVVPVATAV